MDQLKKSSRHAEQAALHLAAVRNYYESGDESFLTPVFSDLSRILPLFLRGKDFRTPREVLEDVTQNALLGILLGLRKQKFDVEGNAAVVSWAASACWFHYLKFQRRGEKTKDKPGRDDFDDSLEWRFSTTDGQAKELTSTPEEKAKAAELIEAVTTAVLRLDGNVKEAILLHFYHGLSQQEAADKVGTTTQKFLWRITRGLTALKDWAQREGVPSDDVLAALSWVDTGGLFRDPVSNPQQAA